MRCIILLSFLFALCALVVGLLEPEEKAVTRLESNFQDPLVKDAGETSSPSLTRNKRTLFLKKKLLGAGALGFGLGLGVGAIKGYKYGRFGGYGGYGYGRPYYGYHQHGYGYPAYYERPHYVERPVYVERPSYYNHGYPGQGYGSSHSYANSYANSWSSGGGFQPYSSSYATASAGAGSGYHY